MNTKITFEGKVLFINATEEKDVKGTTYKNRTFGVRAEVFFNGSEYKDDLAFQLKNAKCELADNLNVGDDVEVDFYIQGFSKDYPEKANPKENPKNPTATATFVNLVCSDIKKKAPAQAQGQNHTVAGTQPGMQNHNNTQADNQDDLPF